MKSKRQSQNRSRKQSLIPPSRTSRENGAPFTWESHAKKQNGKGWATRPFEFPGNDEVYQLVSEWAIQERRCCPFFDISLRLEPEGGPLWLILTGRPGTKDFIKVDGAAWIKR